MAAALLLAAIAVTILLLDTVRRLGLPKPLLGIPYNAQSAKSLLGDIPGLVAEMSRRGDFVAWITEQNLRSNSVVNQIFLRPFGQPFVVLADHRESKDIQINRTKEFDRTSDFIQVFQPFLNTNQLVLKTGPEWKLHRRLVQDTMSPRFLHEVATPAIYASSLRFIELWRAKMALANGRPFNAAEDISDATLDAVFAFTFGSEFPHSAVKVQMEGLREASGSSSGGIARFERAALGAEIDAMIKLTEETEKVQSHFWPRMKWLFIKSSTAFKRRHQVKKECIRLEIEKAINHRIMTKGQEKPRNTVEHVLDREERLSRQDGRDPDYFGPMLTDEVCLHPKPY